MVIKNPHTCALVWLNRQNENGAKTGYESPTVNREIRKVCDIIHAAGFTTNEEAFTLCRSHSLLSCTEDESKRIRAMYRAMQAHALMPTFWSMFKAYNTRNAASAKPCFTLIAPHTYAVLDTKVLHDPNTRELVVTDKYDLYVRKWKLSYSWEPLREIDKHDLQDLHRVLATLSRSGLKRQIERDISEAHSTPTAQPASITEASNV
jgi:hypothetical protein